MTSRITMLLAIAAFIGLEINASAAERNTAKTIVVESPSSTPTLAQPAGEAMHFHYTGDGRSFLYVET